MYEQLNLKTILFQTIQFSISTQFSSICPIDRTQLGITTPGQSRQGSDSKVRVLRFPQSTSITGASTSNCLASHLYCDAVGIFYCYRRLGHCLVEILSYENICYWCNFSLIDYERMFFQIYKISLRLVIYVLSMKYQINCMIYGGARGVIVIDVRNGHGDTSSNPRQYWLHFT